jgi:osmotically-inducible protein OsmY
MIAPRSDDALRDEVTRELEWDSRVGPDGIHVAVTNRVVALTGTVESYAAKVAAQRAAHRVPGVLDVVNDLVVREAHAIERSDADLAAAIRHALQWDVRVPDERIGSTVSLGHVTLEGTVTRMREREDAEEVVRSLHGVRSLANHISVERRPVEPAKVRAAIEGALARHARHEANRIEVTVENGIVTLTGPVDSFAEKQAVIGLVGHLAGVHAVRDRLMLPA